MLNEPPLVSPLPRAGAARGGTAPAELDLSLVEVVGVSGDAA